MKELQFMLSLKNNLSAPLGKAKQSVQDFANTSQRAFKQVGIGVAGLWGVGKSIQGLLGPAHAVQGALDELSTRDVGSEALEKVYRSAQRFSTAYGKSAADFITATTAIKSQVLGLTDAELPRYATAINTLAVATQGSADQAAGYLAQLSSTFRREVTAMGNVPFAETLASKTAYMVQHFGADLAKMQAMVSASKGMGTRMGVGIDEQFAVMGQLGGQLGTGAGGAYEKFLGNAIAGGKALGLSFTDAGGRLLAFPDILDRLQHKFGANIDGNVKAQAALNKAFGQGAQALTAAWGSADKLRKHIRALGDTKGLSRVTDMAGKMSDSWARLGQVWTRIATAIGMALLPVFAPLTDTAIAAGAQLGKWLEMFPNIARVIGYVSMATLTFAAAGALANIVMGVSRFILVGWTGILKVARVALVAFRIAAIAAGLGVWLLTSPIGLIVLAVAGLAAGVWYLVTRWDSLKAALMDTAAFRWVMDIAGQVGALFVSLWDSIRLGWQRVVAFFAGLSPLAAFAGFAGAIGKVFSGLWDALKSAFGNTYNWIVEKLNHLPGVNIALQPVGEVGLPSTGLPADATAGLAPAGLTAPDMPVGGISRTITHNQQSTTQRGTQVGTVNIYPQNGETLDTLMQSRELAAG